jgi:hypothetical protein
MVGKSPVYPSPHLATRDDDEEDEERDSEETPETPLDEPQPPRVEDPPMEPGEKGPIVVSDW